MSSQLKRKGFFAAMSVVALVVGCGYLLLWQEAPSGERIRQSTADLSVLGHQDSALDEDSAEDDMGFPTHASDGTPAGDVALLGEPPFLGKHIVELLSLTNSESEELQAIVHAMWSQMKQLAREHVHVDPLRTDDENGILCLRLRVPEGEGDRVLQQFERQLYEAFDGEKASRMIRAFNLTQHQYFGSFGRNEMFIRYKVIDDNQVIDNGNIAVIIEQCDPVSGRFSSRWDPETPLKPVVPYDQVIQCYGDLLEAARKR